MTERKLIHVPIALYLHRTHVWVNQHFCVTLTPLSQLLTDKAAPSHGSGSCAKERLGTVHQSFPTCLLPGLHFLCKLFLQVWSLITSVLFKGARGPCRLIQHQCRCHFSANKAFSNALCHLNLMPILQNKYSQCHFTDEKTKSWGLLTICATFHSPWQRQNLNVGSSDKMTLP